MKPFFKEGWAFYEYFGWIFPNGQAWGSHAHWPASTVSHAEPLDEEDSNDAYPPDMSQDNVDAAAMANTVLDAAASTASAASAAITAIATNPSIHDDAMYIDNSSAIELTLAAVGMTSSSKQKHINNPESPAKSPLLSSSLKSSDTASKRSRKSASSLKLPSSRPASSMTLYCSRGSLSRAEKVTPAVAIMGLNHSIHQFTSIIDQMGQAPAENSDTSKLDEAINLVQSRDDRLTQHQKIALIKLFSDITIACTYLHLVDDRLCSAWLEDMVPMILEDFDEL